MYLELSVDAQRLLHKTRTDLDTAAREELQKSLGPEDKMAPQDNWCRASCPLRAGWVCSKPRGHAGRHVAHRPPGEEAYYAWSQDE